MKLSVQEIKEIDKAVQDAESQTAGEIVVYMVKKSNAYTQAYWKAISFGLLTGLLIIQSPEIMEKLPLVEGIDALVVLGLTAIMTLLCLIIPPIHKLFIGNHVIADAVASRANSAFIAEEVFNTSARTGILIFISLFERQVLVLGDNGINAKTNPGDWDNVVETIIKGIKQKSFAKNTADAIRQCGSLLEKSGLPISVDDKNELANNLRYFNA